MKYNQTSSKLERRGLLGVYKSMRKHSTQIGHIFETSKMWENVPNLCRMPNFMYPICVECLHIPMCKHSTQIGYIVYTQSV